MMPYIFSIGEFQLRYYSLMIILGLFLTIYFSKKRAAHFGVKPKDMENILIVVFIMAIIGTRLYYVLFNWSYYSKNLLDIFAVWKGGLAIHGGVIGGFIGAIIAHRYYKIPVLFIVDIIAPLLLAAQGLGRFGNFANGEAHGVPTITPPEIIFRFKPVFADFWTTTLQTLNISNAPQDISTIANLIKKSDVIINFQGIAYQLKEYVNWGISFTNKYMPAAYIEFGTLPVHPTFFYEMILNFIGAFIIIFALWRKDKYLGTGIVFGTYLIAYGFIRGFVTLFRADDLMFYFLRAPHIASVIFIMIGSILIINGSIKLKQEETK